MNEGPSFTPNPEPNRLPWHRIGVWGSVAIWGLVAFVWYFYQARALRVGWNAIELIIGQHLLAYHRYALSIDYPSAIAWRPVLPTLFVTATELVTSDPQLILRFLAALAIAVLTASLHAGARAVFGRVAGHVTAAATCACPAITFALLDHVHSISHFGALLVLGPALAASLVLLGRLHRPNAADLWPYVMSGLLWGLCYLARAELLLFALVLGVMLAWLLFRRTDLSRKARGVALAAYGASFAACFVPYNVHAAHVTRAEGTLIRKPIYGFYISQGWADPRPNAGADSEADGYLYAKQLYGDPESNGESLLRAIARHPAPFWRRVRRNLDGFYRAFATEDYFPALWSALVVAGAMAFGRRGTAGQRRTVVFLVGCFAVSHFVLIFHIDRRYLTIAVPPLLLLLGACGAAALRAPRPALVTALLITLIGLLTVGGRQEFKRWANSRPPDSRGIDAMRRLADCFRKSVPNPRRSSNLEPQIEFVPRADVTMAGEDVFLLAYFSHTAWIGLGADGPFPRGRFYAYKASRPNYRFVPAGQRTREETAGAHAIAECQDPLLGSYVLLELNH